jgi:hypothetical protein
VLLVLDRSRVHQEQYERKAALRPIIGDYVAYINIRRDRTLGAAAVLPAAPPTEKVAKWLGLISKGSIEQVSTAQALRVQAVTPRGSTARFLEWRRGLYLR